MSILGQLEHVASTVLRRDPFEETGEFSVDGQVIAPGATFTLMVSLGRSDFSHGVIFIGLPASGFTDIPGVSHQRLGSTMIISTTNDDAIAFSEEFQTFFGGSSYSIDEWRSKGWVGTDSQLSSNQYAVNPLTFVQLKDARINGNTIEIVIENSGAPSAKFTGHGSYSVYR